MVLATIAAVVVVYFIIMFILHEMFRKIFHTLLFVSFILFAVALIYIFLKGA